MKGELFSVTATNAPRLTRRAQSLLHYAPGLVALVIVIADSGQLTDTDLWGHVRFGQAVLAEHHLITRDTYSYTAFGHQWSNHEWLTEVLMAAAYNTMGVIGLKLWKLASVIATMLLLAMGMAETGAAPTVQLNLFVLAAIALVPQMEFRPQLFTFALLAAMLAILARHNYRRAAPLWLLIPLMALWANLHGGFIMGIAVLGLYAATATIEDFVSGAGYQRGLRLSALALAAFVATMVTPFGLETWSPVLHALRNPMTRIAVTDWQPLAFAMSRQWHASHAGIIYFLCGIAMITAFVVTFALAPRAGDLSPGHDCGSHECRGNRGGAEPTARDYCVRVADSASFVALNRPSPRKRTGGGSETRASTRTIGYQSMDRARGGSAAGGVRRAALAEFA